MSILLHVSYVILGSLFKLYVSFTRFMLEKAFSSDDLKNQFCASNGPKDCFSLEFTILNKVNSLLTSREITQEQTT